MRTGRVNYPPFAAEKGGTMINPTGSKWQMLHRLIEGDWDTCVRAWVRKRSVILRHDRFNVKTGAHTRDAIELSSDAMHALVAAWQEADEAE